MREQILQSAAKLFIQHGYYGLSMRQIAESVGVTKAALYYHFKDKEDMFLAVLGAYLEKLETLVIEIQNQEIDCSEKISLLVRKILKQPVDQRAIIRLASQEMTHLSPESRKSFGDRYHTHFIHRVEAIFESGINAGELRNTDPNVAAWSLLGMMYPYFYPVHSSEINLSDDTIEQLIEIFLFGMTPE
jgi:AcrR family transcriptional regulator